MSELKANEFYQFAQESLPSLKTLWENMLSPAGRVPLGHDGYLKLWALNNPTINADFILLDEAQDSNPVMLQVLKSQTCQVIYVGDPYQQIYEWRGAVNAMEQMPTKRRAILTQSFRFGEGIANAASAVIRTLGAKEKVRGLPTITSHVCPVWPETILCRTNMGVVSHLIAQHGMEHNCHVLGGTFELQRLLEDVSRLKHGRQVETPELFGFANWAEVVAYSASPEGEHMKTFVKLVNEHGEQRLLAEVRRAADSEADCDVILSTAHKAKGREWKTVLVDRDFESSFVKLDHPKINQRPQRSKADLESETRLFYVALTRAIHAVELPATLLAHFGITHTQAERAGQAPEPRVDPIARAAAAAAATTRTREQQARASRPAYQPAQKRPQPTSGGLLRLLRSFFK